MLSAHEQNYFVDNVAFAISILPVATLAFVVMLERMETFRRRAAGALVSCPVATALRWFK